MVPSSSDTLWILEASLHVRGFLRSGICIKDFPSLSLNHYAASQGWVLCLFNFKIPGSSTELGTGQSLNKYWLLLLLLLVMEVVVKALLMWWLHMWVLSQTHEMV